MIPRVGDDAHDLHGDRTLEVQILSDGVVISGSRNGALIR
jgi:hypothetical protein